MKNLILLLSILSLFSCNKKKDNSLKTKTVGILAYNGISKKEKEVVSRVLSDFYNIKTCFLSSQDIPKAAFINIKSPRYRADSIIKIQNKNFPDSVDFVLGLTNKDISITKTSSDGSILKPTWKYNDFGVMGLAYRPGKSSIISNFRLKNNDKSIEIERFKKVVIHEFGHNLGLSHCSNKHCVMTSAAEKISTIDNEKMELCNKCKKIIDFKD